MELEFAEVDLAGRDTAVLACATLRDYIAAAQQSCGTSHPVVFLDSNLHVDPDLMRTYILEAINALPKSIETVLVAMGFCGGSWKDVACQRKLVLPRVDDCVSLVMTVCDEVCIDTKVKGHMYEFGTEYEGFSIGGIHDELVEQYGPEKGQMVFDMMFVGYSHVDIVDTGVYDCREAGFLENARRDAELIDGQLDFVEGSNIMLEKLVSGRWDDQFLVVEPGVTITQDMLFGQWRRKHRKREPK